MGSDRLQKRLRSRLLDRQDRGAEAHREQHQPAQPEGEAERRRPREDLIRFGVEYVARKRVAYRKNVAMEVHAALGIAGRSRSRGDERHVLRCGVDRLEARWLGFHTFLKLAVWTERHDVREDRQIGPGVLQLLGQSCVGQSMAY